MKAFLASLLLALVCVPFSAATAQDSPPPAHRVCPMFAIACPDGSSVSPQGPNCEVPPCPGVKASPDKNASPKGDNGCNGDNCSNEDSDPDND